MASYELSYYFLRRSSAIVPIKNLRKLLNCKTKAYCNEPFLALHQYSFRNKNNIASNFGPVLLRNRVILNLPRVPRM